MAARSGGGFLRGPVCALLVAATSACAALTTPASGGASGPAASVPQLALKSASCRIDRGASGTIFLRRCEGYVENLSGVAMDGVLVSIDFIDSSGVPRQHEQFRITYSPLLPGQTSPWDFAATSTPGLDRFTVTFLTKFPFQPIPTRDDRPERSAVQLPASASPSPIAHAVEATATSAPGRASTTTIRFDARSGACVPDRGVTAPGNWQVAAPRQAVRSGPVTLGLRDKDLAKRSVMIGTTVIAPDGGRWQGQATWDFSASWFEFLYPTPRAPGLTAGTYTVLWDVEGRTAACDGFVVQ